MYLSFLFGRAKMDSSSLSCRLNKCDFNILKLVKIDDYKFDKNLLSQVCINITDDVFAFIIGTYNISKLHQYKHIFFAFDKDNKNNDVMILSDIDDVDLIDNGDSNENYILIQNNLAHYKTPEYEIKSNGEAISLIHYTYPNINCIYSSCLHKCGVLKNDDQVICYNNSDNFWCSGWTNIQMVSYNNKISLQFNSKDFKFNVRDAIVEAQELFQNLKNLYNQLIKYKDMPVLQAIYSKFVEDKVKKETNTCVVCLNNSREIVFVPCGHYATCDACAKKMDKCQLCRKAITTKTKVYVA